MTCPAISQWSVPLFIRTRAATGLFRMLVTLAAFALAGFVACELILACDDPKPKTITVATRNLEWSFDDFRGDKRTDLARKMTAPNREDWEWKKQAVANVIAELEPTILCLQEFENRDVVYRLQSKLRDPLVAELVFK